MLSNDLDVDTVWDDLALLLESVVVRLNQMGETELSGDKDLLTAWELELGSSQGLLGKLDVFWGASDGQENLSDVYSGGLAEGLTESSSHTLLESIGSGAGQHLVDSDDVPWVDSDSHMEVISSNLSLHVLVASNSSSLESLGGNLLLLVTDEMDTSGEGVMPCSLSANVINSELGIWHSSVEPRLWIWLILLISEAPGWSSSHYTIKITN